MAAATVVGVVSTQLPSQPPPSRRSRTCRAVSCIGHARDIFNWRKKSFIGFSRLRSKCATPISSPMGIYSCTSLGSMGPNRLLENTGGENGPQLAYKWPDTQKPRICILGGGFGGLYTALRLESLVWPDDKRPQVVLIDQSDHFVFKPMLYELLSGEVEAGEVAPSFTDLLKNTSIQFIKDRAKRLQPSDHIDQMGTSRISSSGGTVVLESGMIIEYDWLVLALGAEAKLDMVPGSMEYALPFSTLEDAIKVDNKLKELERERFGNNEVPIRVAVVGCGYAGVELAATISERLQDKGIVQAINVESIICPNAPAGNREAALKVLSSRNTQLFLSYLVSSIKAATSVPENGPGNISSCHKFILELKPAERGLENQILETDLVLWTIGSKPLASQLENSYEHQILPLNAKGQAETDETLRLKGHSRIFAIGDSAAIRDSSGRLLPSTAQVAFQQADYAGWNLWAAINGRPLLPFRFQNLGEMMTLGRFDAAVSPSFIEGLTLDGPVGHAARKIAYLLRLPTGEHRVKVGVRWFTKEAIDYMALFQNTLTKVLTGS